eukprot:6189192-Pleurochrysis_carterae.AAC.1
MQCLESHGGFSIQLDLGIPLQLARTSQLFLELVSCCVIGYLHARVREWNSTCCYIPLQYLASIDSYVTRASGSSPGWTNPILPSPLILACCQTCGNMQPQLFLLQSAVEFMRLRPRCSKAICQLATARRHECIFYASMGYVITLILTKS